MAADREQARVPVHLVLGPAVAILVIVFSLTQVYERAENRTLQAIRMTLLTVYLKAYVEGKEDGQRELEPKGGVNCG